MYQDIYKPRINFSTQIQIFEDIYWVVTRIEDSARALALDELPKEDWIEYYHTKRYIEEEFSGTLDYKAEQGLGLVLTIRIPVCNLVFAKLYQDFILYALFKWQANIIRGGYKDEKLPKGFSIDFYNVIFSIGWLYCR